MTLFKRNSTNAFMNRSSSRLGVLIRACLLSLALFVPALAEGRTVPQQPCGTMISSNNNIEVCVQGQFRLEILWPSLNSSSGFTVMVDDSPSFNQPILRTRTSHKYLDLQGLDAGLVPGITYYVRIDPMGARSKFRPTEGTWAESNLDYAYLRKSWETSGRQWLTRFSGVKWDEQAKHWTLDKTWPSAYQVGADAYYLEYALRSAVNMAQVCHDRALIDELVNYLLTYTEYFQSLGQLKARKSDRLAIYPLLNQGNDSERTIPWIEKTSGGDRLRDCPLCDSQFFHPVARLIRIISLLPPFERDPEILRRLFVASLSQFPSIG